MRAFSIPFKKANISLFGRVLTIYPKPTGEIETSISWIESFKSLSLVRKEVKPLYMETPKAVDYIAKNLGPLSLRSAIWTHLKPRHEQWHQDGFDREEGHFHLDFPRAIDKEQIKKIASVLVDHEALTPVESEELVTAFSKANELPADKAATEIVDKGTRDYFIVGKKKTAAPLPVTTGSSLSEEEDEALEAPSRLTLGR